MYVSADAFSKVFLRRNITLSLGACGIASEAEAASSTRFMTLLNR
jgi:hypothetical protein